MNWQHLFKWPFSRKQQLTNPSEISHKKEDVSEPTPANRPDIQTPMGGGPDSDPIATQRSSSDNSSTILRNSLAATKDHTTTAFDEAQNQQTNSHDAPEEHPTLNQEVTEERRIPQPEIRDPELLINPDQLENTALSGITELTYINQSLTRITIPVVITRAERAMIKLSFESTADTADNETIDYIVDNLPRVLKRLDNADEKWLVELSATARHMVSLLHPHSNISLDGRKEIASALYYICNPLEIIPDYVPGRGYADDALVVNSCISSLRKRKEPIEFR